MMADDSSGNDGIEIGIRPLIIYAGIKRHILLKNLFSIMMSSRFVSVFCKKTNTVFLMIKIVMKYIIMAIRNSVIKLMISDITPDRFSDRPIFSKVFFNNMIYFSNMMRLFT